MKKVLADIAPVAGNGTVPPSLMFSQGNHIELLEGGLVTFATIGAMIAAATSGGSLQSYTWRRRVRRPGWF